MRLNETVEMMNNEDYKERFRAEYLQLKIRLDGLKQMLYKYHANILPFTPSCSIALLTAQCNTMEAYLYLLEQRAIIENIKL
jgi:hypothetical protein